MRARAALSVAAAVLACALARDALAQVGDARDDAGAPSTPSTGAIPSGASGAVLTKPKEEEPPPPQPVLTPPRLVKDVGATWPAQAMREGLTTGATVPLVVEIDPTGHVRDARVEAPVGHGFDEAAIEAARQLVFEPARRNGQPVAAKIRLPYVIAPPHARFVGRVVAPTSDARAIAGATVTARAASGETFTATAADDGAFVLDVPAGTYHLTIEAAGRKPQETDETIAPAQEASFVFRLASQIAPAAPPPTAGEEQPEEVTVRGVRPPREVTRRTLEQRELNRIPGTNGDALRALQNLPGVARAPGLAGLLIVRGSAPQDTQVFVDGTLIPLVYHFGGLSSVVPTEILDKIDFYPGNFSAQYGRGMGGIVDVGIRDPAKDRLHGMAQVDLIDARLLAEGPIGAGWRFAVAGRRSWVDVWLKPVLEQTGAGVTTAPVYYDYQAILEKDLTKRSSFRVLFLGSDDRLDLLIKDVNASDPSLAGGASFHTGFWRAQARYKNKFDDDTELRAMLAVGQDFADFALGDVFFNIKSWPITGRLELAQKLARSVTMNAGLDMLYDPYTVSARLPPPTKPGEPPAGPFLTRPPVQTTDTDAIYRPAFYDEMEITPWRGGRLVPGVRLDYAKDTKKWDLAPRFTARQDVTRGFPRTTLKGGVGVFYQPPQPQETNAVFGQPGLMSNRAYHYDVGVEQEITRHVEGSLEGFYKQLDRLVVTQNDNSGTGRSYGLELLLRYKPDARFFGWLAYTLSRTVRRDTPTDPERLSTFDQTHILTVLGSYRLGRGWELGARFRLVSGNMYTPRTYGFYDENVGAYLPLNAYPPNGARLPMFHQLDIRVDKTWRFAHWQLGAYLDVQNVYNQGNVEGVSTNYNATKQTYATGLPFLPSLGLRAEL